MANGMGMGPESSALRLSDADERKISAMTNDVEIVQYLHKLAEQQSLVSRDPYSGDLLATALADNAPRTVSRTLTINGETRTLVGKDDAELNQQEIDWHRQLQNPEPEEQSRDENGRFATQDTVHDAVYTARWATAAEAFMERHPGFYKSEANRDAIGNAVIALHLDDEPSLHSLETAYAALQQGGGIVEDPKVVELNDELKAAKSQSEIGEILARRFGGRGSSGIFGGR